MARTAQAPIPGMGGEVRFGRTAAAGAKRLEIPEATPGRVPLTWTTTVDPDSILVHLWLPGDPQPKERAFTPPAKLREDGSIRQGHPFTPTKTRIAEQMWKAVLRKEKLTAAPYPGPVGMRIDFYTAGNRRGKPGDWDNLGKLISDAGNGILYVDDVQVIDPYMPVHRNAVYPGTNVLVWRLGSTTNPLTPGIE